MKQSTTNKKQKLILKQKACPGKTNNSLATKDKTSSSSQNICFNGICQVTWKPLRKSSR